MVLFVCGKVMVPKMEYISDEEVVSATKMEYALVIKGNRI